MPDQYTLAKFQRIELAPGHKPVMAEIDTVSSHTPWAPLPHMVPWNKVGDGSIFDPQPAESESADTVWQNANTVRQFYGQSIQYSLRALTSWVTQLHDPNLVLIMLGDHQPHTIVSGVGATHYGAGLDHRPRPFGVPADRLLALAGRAAARSRCSARAHGRLPQPVPQHFSRFNTDKRRSDGRSRSGRVRAGGWCR